MEAWKSILTDVALRRQGLDPKAQGQAILGEPRSSQQLNKYRRPPEADTIAR